MIRKILAGCFLAGLALTSSGCIAIAAGAGGAVLWQGGKVISEEKATVAGAVSAVKYVFHMRRITVKEEVTKRKVTQLRGEDASHTKVAVDVFETGARTVRIEVRVGIGEKISARDILADIKNQL